MGLLSFCVGRATGRPEIFASRAPDDDFWYTDYPSRSSSFTYSPTTAMRISAVNACVRLLSETVGALPLPIFQRLANGGKEIARRHPIHDLIHDQPNGWMSSLEWREMGMAALLFRGNWYSEIRPGARGFVDQLIPLHPDYVRVEQLEDYRLLYKVRDPKTSLERTVNQEQMFHVRGLSSDGIVGMSPIDHARATIALASDAQEFGSRFFTQGVTASGVLSLPQPLTDAKWREYNDQMEQRHRGVKKSHNWMIIGSGATATPLTMTNEQAQFLQLRGMQIAEIARMFGRVPLSMICETEKNTSFGTGIESMKIAFVTFSLLSWLERIEQAISRDLILPAARQTYFAEFNVAGLLRGDSAARGEFYYKGRLAGWLLPNEIRALENFNPIPGLDEKPLPANARDGLPKELADAVIANPRLEAIAERVSGSLDHKARVVITKIRSRYQGAEREEREAEFWENHAKEIADALVMNEKEALCLMHVRRRELAA